MKMSEKIIFLIIDINPFDVIERLYHASY